MAEAIDEANGYVVQTEDLWRVYKVGAREVRALRGVSMSIPAETFVVVKGRSGSGKTTLLTASGASTAPPPVLCACSGVISRR